MGGETPLHAPGGLIYKGYHYEAGTLIPLDAEDAERLLEAGQVGPLDTALVSEPESAPEGDEDPVSEDPYAGLNKAQLAAEVADRGVELPDGKVTKAVLLDALVADDAAKLNG